MTPAFSKQFKKDYARRIQGTRMEAEFEELLDMLLSGTPLPRNYHDHALAGEWKGYRDCHLRGDMVVIYRIADDMLYFVRINTHSELFG